MNPEKKSLSTPDLPNETERDYGQQHKSTDTANVNYLSPPLDIPMFARQEFNIQERQETTRAELATRLIGILSATIIASFSLVIALMVISIFVDEKKTSSFDKTTALVKDLITVIFTAQIGLVGTALGFYFGSKSNTD